MKLSGFEEIIRVLNGAQVRYLIVGGIAVNVYGYSRSTYDIDLVIDLVSSNIFAAFQALASIGYRPGVPIQVSQFADPLLRKSWQEEKGMLVLTMYSDRHRETPLDIFVYEPFDFESEYKVASRQELAPHVVAPFIRLETLYAMKRTAGRPKDLADLDELNLLYNKPSSYDGKSQS